jgi:hypothetical protein
MFPFRNCHHPSRFSAFHNVNCYISIVCLIECQLTYVPLCFLYISIYFFHTIYASTPGAAFPRRSGAVLFTAPQDPRRTSLWASRLHFNLFYYGSGFRVNRGGSGSCLLGCRVSASRTGRASIAFTLLQYNFITWLQRSLSSVVSSSQHSCRSRWIPGHTPGIRYSLPARRSSSLRAPAPDVRTRLYYGLCLPGGE